MRRAFAETLTRLAADHPRLVFVTGDMGYQMFDEFHKRYGPRYVNVGVA
ncbi:MAG: 1-deoxy-D-xylulose-5-phosphate synthase, partial [Candidatus Rokubacteria bacterium]|nr:1-deoxy-D-xylulose-5-phosphate synthase [Candidatus Rokubacteria bacterium]